MVTSKTRVVPKVRCPKAVEALQVLLRPMQYPQ